jgi:polo-like kinase 4
MVTGHGPFEHDQSSTLGDVLKRVKNGSFELPNVSAPLKDLLVNLINLEANQRYTVEEVLRHPFFRDEPVSPSFPLA